MVLGLNPNDSNVSYASFLAPVDTALISSRVKKVLEGLRFQFQVMFIELATYIVVLRENIHNVYSINYLYNIVLLRENILVVRHFNRSDSNVSYCTLPCTC